MNRMNEQHDGRRDGPEGQPSDPAGAANDDVKEILDALGWECPGKFRLGKIKCTNYKKASCEVGNYPGFPNRECICPCHVS